MNTTALSGGFQPSPSIWPNNQTKLTFFSFGLNGAFYFLKNRYPTLHGRTFSKAWSLLPFFDAPGRIYNIHLALKEKDMLRTALRVVALIATFFSYQGRLIAVVMDSIAELENYHHSEIEIKALSNLDHHESTRKWLDQQWPIFLGTPSLEEAFETFKFEKNQFTRAELDQKYKIEIESLNEAIQRLDSDLWGGKFKQIQQRCTNCYNILIDYLNTKRHGYDRMARYHVLTTPAQVYFTVVDHFPNTQATIAVDSNGRIEMTLQLSGVVPLTLTHCVMGAELIEEVKRVFQKMQIDSRCGVTNNTYSLDLDSITLKTPLSDWQSFQRLMYEKDGNRCVGVLIQFLNNPAGNSAAEKTLASLGLAPNQIEKPTEGEISYFREAIEYCSRMTEEQGKRTIGHLTILYYRICENILDMAKIV